MAYKLAKSTWGEEEINAIHQVIKDDMYSMGPKVAQYEKEFATYFGSKYAVMCSSGSTANLLMIAALFYTKNPKLKQGDEIIVPAVSWSTTYFPLQQYGLHVKFIDVDLETLNFDLNQLKDAITDKTKAILAVNLLGNPNEFNTIKDIIGGRDILLLEDNCESMGAKYNNQFTGTFGLLGTFSSFFSHHISTMEGGMVVTDDTELYHILLSIRAHGWTRNLPKDNLVCEKSDDWFEESFRFVLPGYNVRPLEMSGAIGIEQLKKLDHFNTQRRKNAEYYKSSFENSKSFKIQNEVGQSSWFGFSFIITSEKIERKQVIQLLHNNAIECRPIVTGDFTQNEVLRYFDYSIPFDLVNAKIIHENGFFVGNNQGDLSVDLIKLKQVLKICE